MLDYFGGLRIIEDPNMVVDGEPYEVIRPWREVLFSWPPFRITRMVTPKVPSREIIISESDGTITCHPVIANEIRSTIKEGLQ